MSVGVSVGVGVRALIQQFGAFSIRQHLVYWIAPMLVMAVLMAMYFSGLGWMIAFICPGGERELGVLEHLQLLILLAIFGLCLVACWRKEWVVEKAVFGFLLVFTCFVFLEEIDYGGHYLEYFQGHDKTFFRKWTGSPTVHNMGDNARYYKRSVYGLMAILFVILPLIRTNGKYRLFSYLKPRLLILTTALLSIVTDLTPRVLIGTGLCEDACLNINIGEFSEILVYYIFLLYVWELVFEKPSFVPGS